MQQSLKKLAMLIPALRRLVEERDRLREALDVTRSEAEGQSAETVAQGPSQRERIAELVEARRELEELRRRCGFAPPGHFYSPVPDWERIRADAARIFVEPPEHLAGLALKAGAQRELLERFLPYYHELCFSAQPQDGLRYHYDNPAYSWSDGILLHCMLRHLEPKRVIEVGSGYSSCMTLDTNELFFDDAIETTFIEPYPELLESLLKPGDERRIRLIPKRVQDVDLEIFDSLQANDILFVDSTHVCKIDSDVNRILFEILPRLASGVYIHFHDIFHPFEYPREWVFEGRAWNEAYLLRAFLQHNDAYRVVLMNTYMEHFHRAFFEEHMPLCLKNPGGSLWLKKE